MISRKSEASDTVVDQSLREGREEREMMRAESKRDKEALLFSLWEHSRAIRVTAVEASPFKPLSPSPLLPSLSQSESLWSYSSKLTLTLLLRGIFFLSRCFFFRYPRAFLPFLSVLCSQKFYGPSHMQFFISCFICTDLPFFRLSSIPSLPFPPNAHRHRRLTPFPLSRFPLFYVLCSMLPPLILLSPQTHFSHNDAMFPLFLFHATSVVQ